MYIKVLLSSSVVFLLGCNSSDITKEFTLANAPMVKTFSQEEIDLNTTRCYKKEYAKELYKRCATCHGEDGDKEALGYSDIIAGENPIVTIDKLKGYRAGTLNRYGYGELMHAQAIKLSDDDIRDLAYYIESL